MNCIVTALHCTALETTHMPLHAATSPNLYIYIYNDVILPSVLT